MLVALLSSVAFAAASAAFTPSPEPILPSTLAQDSAEGEQPTEMPNISESITIEAHEQTDGTFLLFTHGMQQLGLPELLIEQRDENEIHGSALLLNTIAQHMAETDETSPQHIDGQQLQNPVARQQSCNVSGQLQFSPATLPGTTQSIPTMMVDFDGVIAPCPSTTAAPPSPLEVAKRQAMSQLLGPIQQRFQNGLAPDEVLFVKAPFTHNEQGVEWMWVAVEQWDEDGMLLATLRSQPQQATDFSPGDLVEIDVSTVFDYLLMGPNSQREGNTTAAFLARD